MLKLLRTTPLPSLRLRYNYTPVSCYKHELKINPIVSLVLSNGSVSHELHIRLFENVAPCTTENFRRLFLSQATYAGRPLSLIGTGVRKHFARNYIELGHMEAGNCSIYGRHFHDETYELTHDRRGVLTSMSEGNTNDCRFAITYQPCPYFDYKQTAFGEVTAETFDVLRDIERLGEKVLEYTIIESKEMVKAEPYYKVKHEYTTSFSFKYMGKH